MEEKQTREPSLWEALLSLGILILALSVGILVYGSDPHVPMLLGVVGASLVSFRLGFKWDDIEKFMISGITKALQAIMILITIGVLIGVWMDAGVVPSMIYYGLKMLSPKLFLPATVLICSITSIATGSSWGTAGTMGVALMGIGMGLGVNPALTAGAIISGAYFGDKTSPMSDSTNLAAAMAGANIIDHIKFMILPTGVTYLITMIIFVILGFGGTSGTFDTSSVDFISDSISSVFVISPILFLPIIIVIGAIALKVPALPGLILGIISGGIMGFIFQPNANLGTFFNCGMNGFVCNTGVESIDSLLSTGGIMNMTYAITMAILAMMFSGIMTETHQLNVIVDALKKKLIKGPVSLIALTELTCVFSNIVMPDQYLSVVVPGSMYAEEYKKMKLHPVVLSNALDSAGAVSSVLVPWNTCGVFIAGVLGLPTSSYLPFCFFNLIMPFVTIILAMFGLTVADENKNRYRKLKKAQ